MKLLIINSVCGNGSTGKIVVNLAEYYRAQGHEVRIAYGRNKISEKYSSIVYRIGTNLNVKINGIKVRIFDNEGFNAKEQTRKFIKWASEYDPDLLWLHNLHGYYLNVEILFAWIKSRPNMKVVWTLHDCWSFTGHCAHFSFMKCNRWKKQCYKCLQKKEYPKSYFFDNSVENYLRKREAFCGVKDMTIITPSNWLANLVKCSFLKEYSVKVVYNTIDDIVFKPTISKFRDVYNLHNKKIVLGVAAIWNEKKGFKDFLRLSELLDESYSIILVGLTDRQIKKLPASIIGIKRTNNALQLAEIYTAADVFVNLTYEDTYPTVNLEAQACGTPCLTYNTGGSIESVPFENIVEQGDIETICKKIQNICLKGK